MENMLAGMVRALKGPEVHNKEGLEDIYEAIRQDRLLGPKDLIPWSSRARGASHRLYFTNTCVQNSLIASLVTSLSMSPTDSINGTVVYGLRSPLRPPTPKSALR